MVLFDAAMSASSNIAHGREGFYFGENGEHTWYSISKEISRVLHEKNAGAGDDPTPFTPDELVKYWGSEVIYTFTYLISVLPF